MSLKNAVGIYHVIAKMLQASKRPLTCVELFDSEEVRRHASDVNNVSDYLGHMYRRKLLNRVPSVGIGAARWAYSWKNPEVKLRDVPAQRHAQPKLSIVDTSNARVEAYDSPALRVFEEGGTVVVETLHFRMVIQLK